MTIYTITTMSTTEAVERRVDDTRVETTKVTCTMMTSTMTTFMADTTTIIMVALVAKRVGNTKVECHTTTTTTMIIMADTTITIMVALVVKRVVGIRVAIRVPIKVPMMITTTTIITVDMTTITMDMEVRRADNTKVVLPTMTTTTTTIMVDTGDTMTTTTTMGMGARRGDNTKVEHTKAATTTTIMTTIMGMTTTTMVHLKDIRHIRTVTSRIMEERRTRTSTTTTVLIHQELPPCIPRRPFLLKPTSDARMQQTVVQTHSVSELGVIASLLLVSPRLRYESHLRGKELVSRCFAESDLICLVLTVNIHYLQEISILPLSHRRTKLYLHLIILKVVLDFSTLLLSNNKDPSLTISSTWRVYTSLPHPYPAPMLSSFLKRVDHILRMITL